MLKVKGHKTIKGVQPPERGKAGSPNKTKNTVSPTGQVSMLDHIAYMQPSVARGSGSAQQP